MIKHFPQLDVDKVVDFYTKKDRVPIKYVCTTELLGRDTIYDIFYRDTPHPEFGNRYFGLGYSYGQLVITNADRVEKLIFTCIGDVNDEWTYSQGTHDYRTWGHVAIDGGRTYTRIGYTIATPVTKNFVVKDGECVF